MQTIAREARSKIPRMPRRPVAYIGDTTSEMFVRLMAEMGGGFGVFSADARQVVDAVL